MRMTRWDPFRELDEMTARLGRLFPARRSEDVDGDTFAEWAPPLDVQETDTEYLIKADLPDVKREDVTVAVDNGVLAVEGERKMEKEEKGRKFHRVERSYGKFVRRLAIQTIVDEKKVAADFKDGVLNVHLPKSEQAKPRTIDVTSGM